jgi:hypothetical protein
MRPTAPAACWWPVPAAPFSATDCASCRGSVCDPGVASDLGHALPVGRAHALADLVAHSVVIGRLHAPRFGPLVDGLDRADFFPDAGSL